MHAIQDDPTRENAPAVVTLRSYEKPSVVQRRGSLLFRVRANGPKTLEMEFDAQATDGRQRKDQHDRGTGRERRAPAFPAEPAATCRARRRFARHRDQGATYYANAVLQAWWPAPLLEISSFQQFATADLDGLCITCIRVSEPPFIIRSFLRSRNVPAPSSLGSE